VREFLLMSAPQRYINRARRNGKQSKDCRAVGDSAILQDCAGSEEVRRVDGASQGHPEGRVDGEFVRVHWEPTVEIKV
jgi:hypothetical protein